MKLDGLEAIYKGMKAQEIERYRFRYQCNKVTFEVFFFIDETPFKLLFGLIGGSFAFDLIVEKGFRINPILSKPIYSKLCEVLELNYDPNNPFSTAAFFREFDRQIPRTVNRRQKAQPHQVARFYPNVEEADKVYFIRWLYHDGIKSNATLENKEKTKLLLGFKAYEICSAKNISSCWCDAPSKAKSYYFPN